MNCEQFRDILHDYVGGEVAEVKEALAAEHLAVCPECARAARDMKRTRSLTKQYGAELAPEGFGDAVRARIEAELKARDTAVRIPRRPPVNNYRIRLAGLAASLALVVLFGAYISRMQPGVLNNVAKLQTVKDKQAEHNYSAKISDTTPAATSPSTATAESVNETAAGQTATSRSAANVPAGKPAVASSAPVEAAAPPREIPTTNGILAQPAPAAPAPAAAPGRYTGEGSVVMKAAMDESESTTSRRRRSGSGSSSSAGFSGGGSAEESKETGSGNYSLKKEEMTNQALAVNNAIRNYEDRMAVYDKAEPVAMAENESRLETKGFLKGETEGLADVGYNVGNDFAPSKLESDTDVFSSLMDEAEKDFSAAKSTTIKIVPKQYKPAPVVILKAQDWVPTSDPKSTIGKYEKMVKEYIAANPEVKWRWVSGKLVVQGTYSKLQPLRDKLRNELRPEIKAKSAQTAAAKDKTAAKKSSYPPEMPAMFEIVFYMPKGAAPASGTDTGNTKKSDK